MNWVNWSNELLLSRIPYLNSSPTSNILPQWILSKTSRRCLSNLSRTSLTKAVLPHHRSLTYKFQDFHPPLNYQNLILIGPWSKIIITNANQVSVTPSGRCLMSNLIIKILPPSYVWATLEEMPVGSSHKIHGAQTSETTRNLEWMMTTRMVIIKKKTNLISGLRPTENNRIKNGHRRLQTCLIKRILNYSLVVEWWDSREAIRAWESMSFKNYWSKASISIQEALSTSPKKFKRLLLNIENLSLSPITPMFITTLVGILQLRTWKQLKYS